MAAQASLRLNENLNQQRGILAQLAQLKLEDNLQTNIMDSTKGDRPNTKALPDPRAVVNSLGLRSNIAIEQKGIPDLTLKASSVPSSQGMLEQGNIDLKALPSIDNGDGTKSTVRTMTVNFDGKVYLLPTVIDGKVVSPEQAIDSFKKTGKHLGVFDNESNADSYDKKMHDSMGWIGTGSSKPQSSNTPSPLIDSIMKSEGQTTVQGGISELYGFRQGITKGFERLSSAVKSFGHGSPEVKAVVSDLLSQNAEQAGLSKFKDSGVQAAIMSMAHMRGAGGAQAILNSVAGMPITKSGSITSDTINVINGMKPEEFQAKLRQVREQYDKQVYGGKADSVVVNGQTKSGRWWDLFGKGLTRRYDEEQKMFLKMSSQGDA